MQKEKPLKDLDARGGKAVGENRAKWSLQSNAPKLGIPVIEGLRDWDIIIQVSKWAVKSPKSRGGRRTEYFGHRTDTQAVGKQQNGHRQKPCAKVVVGIRGGMGIVGHVKKMRCGPGRVKGRND